MGLPVRAVHRQTVIITDIAILTLFFTYIFVLGAVSCKSVRHRQAYLYSFILNVIILEWILVREGEKVWTGLIWLKDELHSLYPSPNIVRVVKSRKLRWAGHVARRGEGRGVYRILVGRPEGKRPLGRPRHRWEDNIKMDLREIGIGGANWIRLVQDRVQWRVFVNTVMNLRVP
jgi:hypothetical protein